jgi:hypothetical protein
MDGDAGHRFTCERRENMCQEWKRYLIGVAALALGLISAPAIAHCDFITGGGFIVRDSGAKANFGAGGGCKNGAFWGHLQYIDHGNGLNVHWLTITNYIQIENRGAENDPKRMGTRHVCGTARTNRFGDVDFRIHMTDNGEPGVDDIFAIRLGQGGAIVYTTEFDSDHTLGGGGPGGGNIQLHKPNPSTTAFVAGGVCRI